MAVAGKTGTSLPFLLGARGQIGPAVHAPTRVATLDPPPDMRPLLEATRAELARLSAGQAHLFALVGAQPKDVVEDQAAPPDPARVESKTPREVELEFRLFRFFEVGRGEQTTARWTSKKARLLLAYLAMKADAPTPRETLIETFWPGSSPDRGANNLSIAIHQIRTRLGGLVPGTDRGIRVEQGTYRLSPSIRATIDVVEFDRCIAQARENLSVGDEGSARAHLRAAVALCTGDLLESDPYEEWTIEPRRAYAHTYQWALAWLAADAASSGDWGAVLQQGRTMVWRDAANEEGHRLIIQAHGELGNRGEALRQYRECVETLEGQVGVGPSPETKALAAIVIGNLDE